ncbi:MAG: drug/metabolite transporter (DMT)-like permease [Planctomycetota bacterium]|jgi:drug/metabolite transporter (DMT)-like permease
MLLTMLLFVTMDAIAKYLLQVFDLVQVVWARFFMHILWVVIYMFFARSMQFRSNRIGLQLTRSVLLFTVTIFFFLGISSIQLATASTIMYLAPILVTLFAIPLLGEKVGLRRGISVAVGFIGALITVRPGMDGFQIGLLYMLVAAFAHSFYLIATRKIRIYDQPLTSLFYTAITGALVMSFIVPFYWQWPDAKHWLLFIAMGFVGSASHLCLIQAFKSAPASVVAPFTYSSLIWALSFGYILFDELPDRWVLLGATLIIGSGLYIFYREQKLGS